MTALLRSLITLGQNVAPPIDSIHSRSTCLSHDAVIPNMTRTASFLIPSPGL